MTSDGDRCRTNSGFPSVLTPGHIFKILGNKFFIRVSSSNPHDKRNRVRLPKIFPLPGIATTYLGTTRASQSTTMQGVACNKPTYLRLKPPILRFLKSPFSVKDPASKNDDVIHGINNVPWQRDSSVAICQQRTGF